MSELKRLPYKDRAIRDPELESAIISEKLAAMKVFADIIDTLTARTNLATRHLESVRSMPPSPVRDREEAKAEGILLTYQVLVPIILGRIETYQKESA